MNKNNKSLLKSLRTGLLILLALVIYAYGLDILNVNMDELRKPSRQERLALITRALVQPNLVTYEQEEQVVNAPVYLPCPTAGAPQAEQQPATSGPYVTIDPACAEPGQVVRVEGFNFISKANGSVRFVPGNDVTNVVSIGGGSVQTDGNGHFVYEMKLPDRPSPDVQYLRAAIRRNIGTPHFTQTAKDTWSKIIETVFLALLATTIGTLLAIPVSFFAARNLMKPVRSPLTSIALSLLAWPAGIGLGYLVVNQIGRVTASLSSNLVISFISVIIAPVVFWYAFRWSMPAEETRTPGTRLRIARLVVLFLAIIVGFYALYQAAGLTASLGSVLTSALGPFGFMGNLLFQVSVVLQMLTPVIGGLAAGGALSSVVGSFGQTFSERRSPSVVKAFNLVVAAAAGAVLFGLVGALIQWLYEINRPEYTFWAPVITGAAIGLLLAAMAKPKDTLPTGLVIYYVTRTILNTLRSVEALVMAIVFVVAVGIGPFAGALALGLHTIVSLAKLYSEQVESILPGPLEAVQATGANRLQTIIYAVVPQIVPPYISYTMYRWDINVRMSTIIGFVGGGGIGFLLQQNINLFRYRDASAQMLAIAVVVSLMDYISSVLRERTV